VRVVTYAIHHYPTRLIDVHRLDDGRRVTVRPILPQDALPPQEFVRALSPRSRYLRFHGPVNELTPAMLQHLTEVDYVGHLALVAETFDAGAAVLVGEARFVRAGDSGDAEFALAVSDGWQGLGIGRLLLTKLLGAAQAAGVRRLAGHVLPENGPMIGLARRLGFDVRPYPADPGLVEVGIDPQTGDRGSDAPQPALRRSWLGRMARRLPLPATGLPRQRRAGRDAARAVAS
jgi:acetyltransferase